VKTHWAPYKFDGTPQHQSACGHWWAERNPERFVAERREATCKTCRKARTTRERIRHYDRQRDDKAARRHARERAIAALIAAHGDEWDDLLTRELTMATLGTM
jgi:hypothetical protein